MKVGVLWCRHQGTSSSSRILIIRVRKLASTCACGLRPDPDPAGGPNCVMHLDAMHDVEGRAS